MFSPLLILIVHGVCHGALGEQQKNAHLTPPSAAGRHATSRLVTHDMHHQASWPETVVTTWLLGEYISAAVALYATRCAFPALGMVTRARCSWSIFIVVRQKYFRSFCQLRKRGKKGHMHI